MSNPPGLPVKLADAIAKAEDDICPKCNGALDTGWECNDCGFDAMTLLYPAEFN